MTLRPSLCTKRQRGQNRPTGKHVFRLASLALAPAILLLGTTALSAQSQMAPTGQGETATSAPSGCPNVDPTLPIAVGADQSDFQKRKAEVVLKGNVTITQGVLNLFADVVTIKYHSGDTRDMGTQGTISSLEASGTVKVECEGDRAHGRLATYDVAAKTITLTGDVLLVRDDNILKGDTLVLDLATGNSSISGGGATLSEGETRDTRIKAVFTPPPEDE